MFLLSTHTQTLTDGKGVMIPIIKEIKLVNDVIVMDTAASAYVRPIRSGTVILIGVRRQAASSTKASSIPTPEKERERERDKVVR